MKALLAALVILFILSVTAFGMDYDENETINDAVNFTAKVRMMIPAEVMPESTQTLLDQITQLLIDLGNPIATDDQLTAIRNALQAIKDNQG